MTKPIWKSLISLVIDPEVSGLTCQECYSLMDQYTDLLEAGMPPSEVMLLVKRHLSHCPECDEIFQTLLVMVQEADHNQQSAPL